MTESFANIVGFLTVCLYEDEGAAKGAIADWPEGPEGDEVAGLPESLAVGIHLHRWRPRRVLAEVAAKRRLLKGHLGCTTYDDPHTVAQGGSPCWDLREMAAVYSEHDGYRPEWAPTW